MTISFGYVKENFLPKLVLFNYDHTNSIESSAVFLSLRKNQEESVFSGHQVKMYIMVALIIFCCRFKRRVARQLTLGQVEISDVD